MNRREACRLGLGGAAALVTAGQVAGCASLDGPQTQALLLDRPAGLPARATVADTTPFVAGDDGSCGPAALAMLLRHAGLDGDLARLREQVYLPGRGGSLQPEMLAGLRRHGALACVLAPEVAAALQEVAAGHPVLMLLNLSLPIWPRWHYLVLVGYDLDRREVQVHSGEHAAALWSLDTLEHTWARSGRWAALGLRPGDLPATAQADTLQTALLDFERSQGVAAALPGWQSAQARFPQALVLGLGWANALLADGQTAAATQAFADLAQRHDSAVAWNNLAVLKARQAQPAEARAAWAHALARVQGPEPQWRAAVEQTGRELGY
jgi:hypothetical protein